MQPRIPTPYVAPRHRRRPIWWLIGGTAVVVVMVVGEIAFDWFSRGRPM